MINAELIKRLRETNGWSRQDLATAAGIGIATVQRVESGNHQVSYGVLERIAKALDVVTAALLTREAND